MGKTMSEMICNGTQKNPLPLPCRLCWGLICSLCFSRCLLEKIRSQSLKCEVSILVDASVIWGTMAQRLRLPGSLGCTEVAMRMLHVPLAACVTEESPPALLPVFVGGLRRCEQPVRKRHTLDLHMAMHMSNFQYTLCRSSGPQRGLHVLMKNKCAPSCLAGLMGANFGRICK